MSKNWLIGIDEVGRGPLAGPVLVGGVWAPESLIIELGLNRDSKRMSVDQRLDWVGILTDLNTKGDLVMAWAKSDHQIIDQYGINTAIQIALNQVLAGFDCSPNQARVLLDGYLKAPSNFIHQESIVRGDEQRPVIAAASILAKVKRDQIMIDLGQLYPEYRFHQHKGYATEDHYLALLQYGLSPIHRLSFTGFLNPDILHLLAN